MTVDHLESDYHHAERRLRDMLFGDGSSSAGLVKGEERRLEATRLLRRMRDAFDAALAASEERARKAEARVADLDEELRQLASRRSRRRPKVDP
jgi:hypothetical protein